MKVRKDIEGISLAQHINSNRYSGSNTEEEGLNNMLRGKNRWEKKIFLAEIKAFLDAKAKRKEEKEL